MRDNKTYRILFRNISLNMNKTTQRKESDNFLKHDDHLEFFGSCRYEVLSSCGEDYFQDDGRLWPWGVGRKRFTRTATPNEGI